MEENFSILEKGSIEEIQKKYERRLEERKFKCIKSSLELKRIIAQYKTITTYAKIDIRFRQTGKEEILVRIFIDPNYNITCLLENKAEEILNKIIK
ncbi:MAG: hypothetical protein RSB87_05925 [Clostridia bacterium]